MTRVAIAGGGLAGLTCALSLAEAGCQVSVFEGLPHLGGPRAPHSLWQRPAPG